MFLAEAPILNNTTCDLLSTDFVIYCDLRNLLELQNIVSMIWFARPHIEISFIIYNGNDVSCGNTNEMKKFSDQKCRKKRTPKGKSRDSSGVVSRRNKIPDNL